MLYHCRAAVSMLASITNNSTNCYTYPGRQVAQPDEWLGHESLYCLAESYISSGSRPRRTRYACNQTLLAVPSGEPQLRRQPAHEIFDVSFPKYRTCQAADVQGPGPHKSQHQGCTRNLGVEATRDQFAIAFVRSHIAVIHVSQGILLTAPYQQTWPREKVAIEASGTGEVLRQRHNQHQWYKSLSSIIAAR